MNKHIIFLMVTSSLLLAQPPKSFYPEKLPFGTRPKVKLKHQVQGLSKSVNQNWRCIAQTHYQNTDTSSELVNWSFSERDTFIYDEIGKLIQMKISRNQEGWAIDSLIMTDSCIYDENNVIQSELLAFYENSEIISWSNINYSYPLAGKACVRTAYELKNEKDTWIPVVKDSMTYSVPVPDFMDLIDYTHFIGYDYYVFDTLKSTWKITNSINRIDSECTANTLVERGGYWLDSNWFDVKQTYLFRSANWKDANLSEESYQSTNPSTGEYYLQKTMHFQDAYGNDTLYIHVNYDTSETSWDTNATYRLERTYDTFGNETINIESFSYGNLPFRVDRKVISTYAQIGEAPTLRQRPSPSPKISMSRTASSIRFTAPGIAAVNLYDLSGKKIAGVGKTSESGSSSLSISLVNTMVSQRMYIAEILFKNAKRLYLVSIQR